MTNKKGYILLIKRVSWYIYLVKKFTALKAKCSMLIIVFSILSQILLLASFVVPLKMLFLVGVKEFKLYHLGNYTIASKDELALAFVIIMFSLLILTLSIENFSKYIKLKCSNDIRSTSTTFLVYPNQDTMALYLYDQYTKGLSSVIFIFLILLVLSYLYPIVTMSLVIYWLFAFYAVLFIFEKSKQFQESVTTDLLKIVNTLGLLGFLVVFVIIISDFISSAPSVSLMFAVISLVLTRHMTGSITVFIQSIKVLYIQKQKLEVIFFQAHTSPSLPDVKDNFWEFFEEEKYKEWIPSVLNNILKKNVKCISFKWLELGIPNLIAFIITTENKDKYMLKVFGKNLNNKASKEASLYEKCDLSSFSNTFRGIDMIKEFHCHLFEFKDYTEIEPQDFINKRLEVLKLLSQYELPESIVKQYKDTHKLIYGRIHHSMIAHMFLVANKEEKILLKWFERNLEKITNKITELPLRLVVPAITADNLWLDSKGNLTLLHFDNWMIEPFGYTYTSTPREQEALKAIVSEDEHQAVLMVQQLKACEMHCNRFMFKKAILNISEINILLNNEK